MLRDGGLKAVADRGVWVAREGRERRRTFRERGCGVDDEDWAILWCSCEMMIVFYFLCSLSCGVISSMTLRVDRRTRFSLSRLIAKD
jgi:hypothetical protein